MLITGFAGDGFAQARPGTADITIVARSPNSVQVEERYLLGPSPQSLELRVLTRPCIVIEHVRFARDGRMVAVAEARKGPWITWRDTTPPGTDSVLLVVRYDAWLGGSGIVPLVHLAAPLARTDSATQGAVTVAARFSRGVGQVEFPHMTRQAENEWSGRYVAVPSFVKVGPPTFRCDLHAAIPPDTGGLVWRYWLLIGIMAAWVPIYLLWARRTGDRA